LLSRSFVAASKSGFPAHFHGCLAGQPIISRTRKAGITGIRCEDVSMDASAYQLSPPARDNNTIPAVVIVLLLVVAAAFSAWRKPVTTGFDELAHASYVAQLQRDGSFWPRLERLRLLDARTFAFTAEASYLNHPPLYYHLMALTGPRLEDRRDNLLAHRLINVAIVVLGVAVLFLLALKQSLTRLEFYALMLPVVLIPVLPQLAGSINNDNLAFTGGAITLLGTWSYLESKKRRWLLCACLGVAIASAAKITGLMLAGGMLGTVMLIALWQRRIAASDFTLSLLAIGLSAVPYIALMVEYGSPAPNTAGQLEMLKQGSDAAGWSEAARFGVVGYAFFFLANFIADWMPALEQRSLLNLAMLALPVAAVLLACAGLVQSLLRLIRGEADELDIIIVGGMLAIVATMFIHAGFSYRRHLDTGWMMDAYPRYYLPLIAIVPVAGFSFANSIVQEKARTALLLFLIACPFMFGLLGRPY
jgi:hypothetical protein